MSFVVLSFAFHVKLKNNNNAKFYVCLKCDVDLLAEDVSDRCMGELMGIGSNPVKCFISSECIRVMTQTGRTGYHITHQILYGILAEQVPVVIMFDL